MRISGLKALQGNPFSSGYYYNTFKNTVIPEETVVNDMLKLPVFLTS